MTTFTRRRLFGLLAAAGIGALGGATVTFVTTPRVLVYRGYRAEGWFSFAEAVRVEPYLCRDADCIFESDFIVQRLQYVAGHISGRYVGASGRAQDGAPYEWMDFDRRYGDAREQAAAWNDSIHGRTTA